MSYFKKDKGNWCSKCKIAKTYQMLSCWKTRVKAKSARKQNSRKHCHSEECSETRPAKRSLFIHFELDKKMSVLYLQRQSFMLFIMAGYAREKSDTDKSPYTVWTMKWNPKPASECLNLGISNNSIASSYRYFSVWTYWTSEVILNWYWPIYRTTSRAFYTALFIFKTVW